MTETFESVDFIAALVSPMVAFPLGEKTADPLEMYMMDILIPIPDRMRGNSIWNWNTRHGGRARNAKRFWRQGESRLAAAD